MPDQYGWLNPAPTQALPRMGEETFLWRRAVFYHCRDTLEALGNQKGLLGLIFNRSQNRFGWRRFMAALALQEPSGRPISSGDFQMFGDGVQTREVSSTFGSIGWERRHLAHPRAPISAARGV